MDNLRLILIFALAFVGLLIYQAWMEDYGRVAEPVTATEISSDNQPLATPDDSGVPDVAVSPHSLEQKDPSLPGVEAVIASDATVTVETDLLNLVISTRGGTVQSAVLLDYLVAPEDPEKKVELLHIKGRDLYIGQSGLIGSDKGDAPSHEALYAVDKGEFRLEESQDSLVVPMKWTSDKGIQVTKRFVFQRGKYEFTVEHEVVNRSGTAWTARDYAQLQRTEPESQNGFTTYTYTGGVIYTPQEKYEKIDFDEMAKKSLDRESERSWLAMIQHYFVAAWIPPIEQMEHFYTNSLPGGRYLLGSYSPSITVSSDTTHTFSRLFYIGPKLQDELENIAEGLELTVDYGWLTILAKPIFWLLKTIHNWVGNWGWAIILLTILIKSAFYKLSETSYKSLANMRKFTPRIQALKDRYGDDKDRLNQAMMDLYKKEKINPLGGCLPILVQIPVFIALYWVLLESVELRQAPFVLWINNLSAKDPYFVLPLIMGVSMYVQQKLNPAPPDPMQAKIMMSLPFVFTIFFAFFPSGLVLYWVVNNILSILQQWHITRNIEKANS
jgi:YidC/Oxa1 family membrane protein insertase